MLTRSGSGIDGIFSDESKLQQAYIKSGYRVELSSGERYLVEDSPSGGLLLASGNYANPVTDGASKWSEVMVADFNLEVGVEYQVEALVSTVEITLPSISVGDKVIIHNASTSTQTVRVLNPSYTIQGSGGIIPPGLNLVISSGETANLLAKNSNTIEVA